MSRLQQLSHAWVERLRRWFVAGLLVFVPVGFTVLALLWIVEQLDSMVLPGVFALFGLQSRPPRVVGALVTLGVVLGLGAATRNVVGRSFVHLWERVVERIPIARSLYSVVKQFMEAALVQSGRAFSRVVLVEYPRKGVFAYAFVTGRPTEQIPGLPPDLIKVFVPKTPNPTTGFYLLARESELYDSQLSVEQALRLIVSAGITGDEALARPPLALERQQAP